MFDLKTLRTAPGRSYRPVSSSDSKEELQRRVDELSGDEYYIYRWLRESYSPRWIAESLLISRGRYKQLFASLCRKLGVTGTWQLLNIYGRLERKRESIVSTEEIDAYVEQRTEEEIRYTLQNEQENKTGRS